MPDSLCECVESVSVSSSESPLLTAPEHRICDRNQLSRNRGADSFVRFSGHTDAIYEGVRARVVMCCDHGRLEHRVPQGATTTGNDLFSVKGAAVTRIRGQSSESGSLLARDGAH